MSARWWTALVLKAEDVMPLAAVPRESYDDAMAAAVAYEEGLIGPSNYRRTVLLDMLAGPIEPEEIQHLIKTSPLFNMIYQQGRHDALRESKGN